MPPMFQPGDIVFAPWRAEDGVEKYRYMVVLVWSSAVGMYAMWTGTAKEGKSGGRYAFTQHECEQAGFSEPCRFDPSRVILYRPEYVTNETVHPKPGRLSRKAMERIEAAVVNARPSHNEY